MFYIVLLSATGEYRRQAVHGYQNHDFFRMDNEEAMKIREQVAKDALDDAFRWFENDDGEVARKNAVLSKIPYV